MMRLRAWHTVLGVAIGIGLAVVYKSTLPNPPRSNVLDVTIKCPKDHEAICQEMMDAAMAVGRKYQADDCRTMPQELRGTI